MSAVYGETSQVKLTSGTIILPSSISPNLQYGVSVFDNFTNDLPDQIDANRLFDLKNGKAITEIRSGSGYTRKNHGLVLPARWSLDSSLLLWEEEGKWSADSLELFQLNHDKVIWHLDLLEKVQKSILSLTHKAAPRKYKAAKKFNEGGCLDGFTVNVRVDGDKLRDGMSCSVKGKPVSLPLKVHAELICNPKEIDRYPSDAVLNSYLDGVVSPKGKFTVESFHLRSQEFTNALSASWLELTDPSSAAVAPLDYGDRVMLDGKTQVRKRTDGQLVDILILKQKITIRGSNLGPPKHNVSEITLQDTNKGEKAEESDASDTYNTYWGVLGYSPSAGDIPSVIIKENSD